MVIPVWHVTLYNYILRMAPKKVTLKKYLTDHQICAPSAVKGFGYLITKSIIPQSKAHYWTGNQQLRHHFRWWRANAGTIPWITSLFNSSPFILPLPSVFIGIEYSLKVKNVYLNRVDFKLTVLYKFHVEEIKMKNMKKNS